MKQRVIRSGRLIAVGGPVFLGTLTGSWLCLGAGTGRVILTWGAFACLTALLGVWAFTTVGRPVVSRDRAYADALAQTRASAGDTPTHEKAAPPGELAGSGWAAARLAAVGIAVVSGVVLFIGLLAGSPTRDARAESIADHDHVIAKLRITSVDHVEHKGSARNADVFADYTVEVPEAGDSGADTLVVRAQTYRNAWEPGDRLYVAYVPGQLDIGGIAETRKKPVETRLAGWTLPFSNVLVLAVGWLVGAGVSVAIGVSSGDPRRTRKVTSEWVAVRARVTGCSEYVEKRAGEEAEGRRKGKQSQPNRYKCLGLATAHDGQAPLKVPASPERAAALLNGAHGWLLWLPTAHTKRRVPAAFVSDEGWHLPGRVPQAEAERIATAVHRTHEPQSDSQHAYPVLEFGALWLRTVPRAVLAGLLVSLAAVAALLLPWDGGWLRTCTAVVGALAPLVGFLVHVAVKGPDASERPEDPERPGREDAQGVSEVPASPGDR
ncbi:MULTISPECIES: hypothetical protein [unclassified Streptomyces]|uniref:hypothetical protein n=1 Tax=unclassified Streptomyces TaxID=2593676 RepID=UPI00278C00B8|nr:MULTISPECIES: hypothetical protein [unclassified Streptomyces]